VRKWTSEISYISDDIITNNILFYLSNIRVIYIIRFRSGFGRINMCSIFLQKKKKSVHMKIEIFILNKYRFL
jgi:hypothetical protein